MTTEQRKKNCSTLNDLCNTVKDLDDRLVSEHTDRTNTELQLQLDFDSKVTQNTNQLRNEFSQEIEAVNSNIKIEVNKAIASVVDEAPESFDTLKEAADWIQTHGTEAAVMQSAITNLENNLTQEALDRTTQLSNKANKDLANVNGTLPISNGGTGNTTAKDACNTFLNALDTGASTPEDNDYYISQYVNGGTTTTTYHRRPVSALWEYIKHKISLVLGLTSSNYGGTSAKAISDSSGNNIVNTYATKSVATTTQNGLMSSSDKSKLDTLVPVGTIFSGVYSTAPTGYLLCNGSSFNKDTYPKLYSVLGTNVLPDLRGKFLQGANGNLKQSIEAGLPNVTGSIGITGGANDQFLTDNTLANISVDGALYITGTASKKSMANGDSSYTTPTGFGFDASKSNSVYGKSTTVQPPAYTVNFIIKY